MKNPPPLHCELNGTTQELPAFFALLGTWAQTAQVPEGVATRMGLILDEWLSNVVEHAYRGQGGPVTVEVRFLPPHTLRSVVRDQGPAFDPTAMGAPNVQASLEEREIGGLGLHFIRQWSERFTYRRDGDCNEVTLSHSLTQ